MRVVKSQMISCSSKDLVDLEFRYTVQRSAQLHDKAMRRRAHGHSDGTNSRDRIINFSSRSSDDSSQHLSPEEKACLTFLEETIESIETEDD
ncbi:uncharacterized protein zgc:158258, partial [Ictalurus furcatus]|uniref:uncharacterized protein zgc:158258 n=1 Tax=Ictalurus furcatus TaxID=66913 RepID=UPI00235073B8